MKMYPVNAELGRFWKQYPLRVSGPHDSHCCKMPTVLVQSMSGGFVTQYCSGCGKFGTISEKADRAQTLRRFRT